jgi:hypothetical protein
MGAEQPAAAGLDDDEIRLPRWLKPSSPPVEKTDMGPPADAVLFNPYTGTRRDHRDIASDPYGELIVKDSSAMRSAPRRHMPGMTLAECVVAEGPSSSPVEKPEAHLAARGVRAAWWSTGEFAIEDSDGRVTIFPPDVAAPILAFAARLGRVAA